MQLTVLDDKEDSTGFINPDEIYARRFLEQGMELKLDIKIPAEKMIVALVLGAVIFLMLDMLIYHAWLGLPSKIGVLFNITLEGNIPTWYSSNLALITGFMAVLAAHYDYKNGHKRAMWAWLAIGLFFIYMSMDDAAKIHERVATVLASNIEVAPVKGEASLLAMAIVNFQSYYWQLLILPFFGVAGLAMLIYVTREFGNLQAKKYFYMGFSCYVFAVLLDYLDGMPSSYDVIIQNTNIAFSQARHTSRAIEEFIEMLGTSFILMSFVLQIESQQKDRSH